MDVGAAGGQDGIDSGSAGGEAVINAESAGSTGGAAEAGAAGAGGLDCQVGRADMRTPRAGPPIASGAWMASAWWMREASLFCFTESMASGL